MWKQSVCVCVKVRYCGWEESGLLNGVKKQQHLASTGLREGRTLETKAQANFRTKQGPCFDDTGWGKNCMTLGVS